MLFFTNTRRAVALVLAGLLVGCGSSGPRPEVRRPAPKVDGGPVIEVSPVVVSSYTEADLVQEFERAKALLLGGKHREAAEVFDKLERHAPDGEIGAASLYNAAVGYEALGEREASATRLRELVRRFPGHALERSALFRLGRALAYLERWSELVAVAEKLIARQDLVVLEVIEARGARALGLVEQDLVEEAAREITTARDLVERERLGEAGKPPIELAQLWFALGEVRRKRSEAIKFEPMPPNFAETLEKRCQGLLDAQGAYTEAMRSLDAHGSAMAGYRVGQLYQELHRDVMRVPPPAAADTLRKKQLFEGAMRLRYRVLLEKGLKMMEGTVRLGDRTGEASAWIGRAREAQRALELALADEKAALARLPFTEDELREALEALKKKP
ncbi:hypothetical protein [Polyangium fumosum]|uniref:Tetratricopeptide repeat protein n=1 Tax=Polyangium fumosum TaxID=889272 RepID=A0A4U1IJR0_9BACT|nr:hypothetical protein [Polyangium fumosum]TKC94128.1 hypothetical protein E8A74_48775 [Polyangium fumosum]